MDFMKDILNHLETKMQDSLKALKTKFAGLNVGRANPELLAEVKVEAYGALTPIVQLANISVQEPRCLVVNVWDANLVKAVDGAIRTASLGLNTKVDGNIIKIHLPQPTEERRHELVKMASHYAEEVRTALKKSHRREALDHLELLKKDAGISEDDVHAGARKIEQVTTTWSDQVGEVLKKKIHELETL